MKINPKEAYHLLSHICGTISGNPMLLIGWHKDRGLPLFVDSGGWCLIRCMVENLRTICDAHLALSDEEILAINVQVGMASVARKESMKSLKKRGPKMVYLMRNNRNGLIKIGVSSRPAYREKTLQSDEPAIELVWVSEGGEERELELHARFANKRVRGEWFKLSGDDVRDITQGEYAPEIS